MNATVSECVAVAGTLAGAGIGVQGALRISRLERRSALNDRMRDAFATYLGAVYPAVSDLRDLPHVQAVPKVDQLYNNLRGEKATYVSSRRRERQIFGDGFRERAHRVAITVAELQVLPLPEEVKQAVNRTNDYLERLGHSRTPEIKAEWQSVHAELMRAAEILQAPRSRHWRFRWRPATNKAGHLREKSPPLKDSRESGDS